jgi:glutathione S-transferase
MKLFFSPGACSLAPHIVLRESGVAFSLEKVDIPKRLTASGVDYYSITSKGQVPLLQLADGSTLSEGPVIAQYIADQAAAANLLPAAGSMARYRVLEWQNYITSELHKGFSPLFNPAFDAAAKAIQAGMLRKKFEWVDGKLAGTHYLTGGDFTVADAYLFTVAGWSKLVGLDLSDLAHLQAFLARVAARPAVQAAMQAEGLIPA